jgi:signal transduction histidine kinase
MLVHRALSSAEAEEQAGRQALADTAFAAVERELASLLEREESRAWDEWRHLRVPEGEVLGSEGLVRSPLADLPADPWILGWFQVEPDGAVGSPLVPQDELAAALALSETTTQARERDAEIRAWVTSWLAARPDRPVRPAPEREPPRSADEGPSFLDRIATREAEPSLSNGWSQPAPAAAQAEAESMPGEEMSPRKELEAKKKVADTSSRERRAADRGSYRAPRQETATLGKADVFSNQAQSDVVQQVAMRNTGIEIADPDELEETFARSGRADLPLGSEPAPSPAAGELSETELPDSDEVGKNVDVEVEAFTGELDAQGRLVLQRLVVVAGVPYRQGLLLDLRQLAVHLDPLELLARTAGAEGTFTLGAERPAAADFVRRLPAPFDPLQAALRLEGSAGDEGVRAVLTLTALLAVLGLLAFFAVDRMIGTTLTYAERRSDFVSAVTHELKTPLAAIRLHGEMLHEGIAATEEKRQASYRTITAECERLTRLVDNVLELSRLEKGTRSVHLMAGPLEPVLREALDVLEPHARSAGFALELEVEQGLAARFDRDALLQVVFNLVDNGLKYARDAGDKRILLVARRDGDRVALLVRDFGPGVPPRHLRHIFEPFWRGERELTRRSKGTGIGLPLVRGLVERMQGGVGGRNLPDGGFEVRVTLPGATA